jgi:5-(carboxyamino)imidazole ribonucleotide synthase
MLNIIGQIPPREKVLSVEGAHLHLYGKAPTEKRKVGHVTLVGGSPEALERAVAQVERLIGTDSNL